MVLPRVTYGFEHEYVAVPEGAHTLTADQFALDGTTVVASVTRTFTSSPVPVATVAITAPPDGASSGIPQVTFSGTAQSNVDKVVRLQGEMPVRTGLIARAVRRPSAPRTQQPRIKRPHVPRAGRPPALDRGSTCPASVQGASSAAQIARMVLTALDCTGPLSLPGGVCNAL
jgi:hypothetical protein